MSRQIRCAARVIGAAGLGAVGVLHAAWATGSSWPESNPERLTDAVLGRGAAMPSPAACLVVAAGTGGAGLLAAGALGDGRLPRLGMRAMGTVLLARAAVGGSMAIPALDVPAAGERFQRLDRRFYRPLTAVLGAALWVAAGRRD